MLNQPTNQRNYYLNFLKGIGCIGVVFIHITFPGEFGRAIHKLAQFAVPVFFMISGFYAFCNSDNTLDKLIRRAKRIGLITLYAVMLYFGFTSIDYIYNNSFVEYLYKVVCIKNLCRMIILNNFSAIGGFPLWFLPALLYCYLFQIIVEKYKKQKYSYCLIPILYIIHIIISLYSDSKYMTLPLKATFLGSGLFWFVIGNYIAFKKDKILNILPKNYLLYFTVFASGLVAVILNLFTPNFAEIAIVVYATLLFLLAIKNPTVHINKAFEFIGDKLSLNVYIWHIIVARGLSVFINHLGFTQNSIYLAIRPIVVVIFTLLVSLVIYMINNSIFQPIKQYKPTITKTLIKAKL